MTDCSGTGLQPSGLAVSLLYCLYLEIRSISIDCFRYGTYDGMSFLNDFVGSDQGFESLYFIRQYRLDTQPRPK